MRHARADRRTSMCADRTARESARALASIVAAGGLAAATTAAADDRDDVAPAASAADAVSRGAVIAGAGASRGNGRRALAFGTVGFDGAIDRKLVATAERLQSLASVRADVLREEASGLDLSIASGYHHASFNTVPAVFGRVGVARTVGGVRLGGVRGSGSRKAVA